MIRTNLNSMGSGLPWHCVSGPSTHLQAPYEHCIWNHQMAGLASQGHSMGISGARVWASNGTVCEVPTRGLGLPIGTVWEITNGLVW